MKNKICFGLWLIFIATSVSVRAEDNPAQAAARAALVKMLFEANQPQTPPATNQLATNATPWDMPEPSRELTIARTNSAQTNVVLAAPATLAVRTTPDVPAAVAPATPPVVVLSTPVVAPIKLQPAAAAPAAPKPAPLILGTKQSSTPAATNQLVTIYGTVYKNAQVEKVYWDGVMISYSTSGGGLGISKVYFKDLPKEFRQQYEK
jgi:hypothetical protein